MGKKVLFLLALCMCCVTADQPRTISGQVAHTRSDSATRARANRRKRPSARIRRRTVSNRGGSVVGLALNCLAKDTDNNIWAGGSVFLLRGLLLRYDGMRLTQTILPNTWSVGQVSFPSRDRGWMLADRHDLYRTTDGGQTWRKVELDLGTNPPNLEALCFTDPEHGWIAGWRGTIYQTDDGGASWRKQDSSTTLDILRVTFVNHLHGWARASSFGEGSALIATSDGGHTWKTIVAESKLYNFTFVDDFEGWALDEDRGIVHTVDSGETWTVQRPADKTNLRLLFFLNNREGWVMGAEALLHTADGGQTWKRLNEEDLSFNPEDVLFVDSVHGWAAEAFGANLFRTNDAGRTWEPISRGWQRKVADEVYQTAFPQGKT